MALSERFSSLALQSHPGVEWTGGWACLTNAAINAEGGLSCEMTYCFPYRDTPHSSKPTEPHTHGLEAPAFWEWFRIFIFSACWIQSSLLAAAGWWLPGGAAV